MLRYLAPVLCLLGAGACTERMCTALGIIRDMPYETTMPADVDTATATFELCIGAHCDEMRVQGTRCEDIDGRTPSFPTTCTFDATTRKLSLVTNTVYGGHAGTDRLVLTAIEGTERKPLVAGTVTYEDTTDDAARGACTEAWKGTFTPDASGS